MGQQGSQGDRKYGYIETHSQEEGDGSTVMKLICAVALAISHLAALGHPDRKFIAAGRACGGLVHRPLAVLFKARVFVCGKIAEWALPKWPTCAYVFVKLTRILSLHAKVWTPDEGPRRRQVVMRCRLLAGGVPFLASHPTFFYSRQPALGLALAREAYCK